MDSCSTSFYCMQFQLMPSSICIPNPNLNPNPIPTPTLSHPNPNPIPNHNPNPSVVFTVYSSGVHFTKFTNMLMNDTTYLLDESMDTLKRIRELQDLMDNKVEWDKLNKVSRGQGRECYFSQQT